MSLVFVASFIARDEKRSASQAAGADYMTDKRTPSSSNMVLKFERLLLVLCSQRGSSK